MNKLILNIFLFVVIIFCATGSSKNELPDTNKILPVMSAEITGNNQAWTNALQILWSEFSGSVSSGDILLDANTGVTNELNNHTFSSSDLSENNSFRKFGVINSDFVRQVQNSQNGFESEILNNLSISESLKKYLLYAAVRKETVFDTAFTNLGSDYFGKNRKQKINYFGIDDTSILPQRDNVRIAYYFSENDYALKLLTGDDEIILFKTALDESFEHLYKILKSKTYMYNGSLYITSRDMVKIPEINFFAEQLFPEFSDNKVKNINGLVLGTVAETIDFELHNIGTKDTSDDVIVKKMSIYFPDTTPKRNFYFDDEFVIFVRNKNSELPYMALKVNDVAAINKMAKKHGRKKRKINK